jgi:hypothetical protein
MKRCKFTGCPIIIEKVWRYCARHEATRHTPTRRANEEHTRPRASDVDRARGDVYPGREATRGLNNNK